VGRDERGASVLHSTMLDESGAWGDMPIDFNDVHLEAMRNYLDASIKT